MGARWVPLLAAALVCPYLLPVVARQVPKEDVHAIREKLVSTLGNDVENLLKTVELPGLEETPGGADKKDAPPAPAAEQNEWLDELRTYNTAEKQGLLTPAELRAATKLVLMRKHFDMSKVDPSDMYNATVKKQAKIDAKKAAKQAKIDAKKAAKQAKVDAKTETGNVDEDPEVGGDEDFVVGDRVLTPRATSAAVDWRRFDLDVFSLSALQQSEIAVAMLRQFGLTNIEPDTPPPQMRQAPDEPPPAIAEDSLRYFVAKALAKYNDVPFHNRFHGFSVFHVTGMMMLDGQVAKFLTQREITSALLAALTHDLGHDGYNNAFEMNNMTERAMRHGLNLQGGVLEAHHNAEAQQLLTETRLIEHLPRNVQLELRKAVAQIIFATDMGRHADHEKFLTEAVDRHLAMESSDANDDADDGFKAAKDRIELAGVMVHCADLSGQAMERWLATQWSEKCLAEFANQVDKEKELGLPVSTFMEGLDSASRRNAVQYGFTKNVVLPLWTKMAQLCPGLQPQVDNVEANVAVYGSDLGS